MLEILFAEMMGFGVGAVMGALLLWATGPCFGPPDYSYHADFFVVLGFALLGQFLAGTLALRKTGGCGAILLTPFLTFVALTLTLSLSGPHSEVMVLLSCQFVLVLTPLLVHLWMRPSSKTTESEF